MLNFVFSFDRCWFTIWGRLSKWCDSYAREACLPGMLQFSWTFLKSSTFCIRSIESNLNSNYYLIISLSLTRHFQGCFIHKYSNNSDTKFILIKDMPKVYMSYTLKMFRIVLDLVYLNLFIFISCLLFKSTENFTYNDVIVQKMESLGGHVDCQAFRYVNFEILV